MPVHITSRSDAEAIIREQVVSTIFQDAPKQSVFMSMARKLPNMTSDQTRIRVLDFLPTAYWVDLPAVWISFSATASPLSL